ncbi:DUF1853 family protein [Acinetobacter qingfengensis]|uniref:Uncharacterized protein n=1 Tax=Acinetobacter qingfengensis TaxID=1262585 RepID=A0A1E7RDV1_9GAMM|nr:DUF1853 family protein [Acinetobacter qingfengensis]KAA8734433.1 DUF1853 family protein [Acinetobacter qingfengensis]OEY97345.1 hypothetical protein BJI46_10185 [Acinetobacter qingfengensis]
MSFYEPWLEFKHPIVRQLAFAIASPDLITQFPKSMHLNQDIQMHSSTFWQNCFKHYHARLHFLDQYPQQLLDFLSQIKSTRLGLRFEGLLWFWLQDSCNGYYDLLGHSIQYHQGSITLGEIDFLLRNRQTGEIEHWEVCLKYYLAEPNLSIHGWIGLNPEDTFLQKLQHLVQQQFKFQRALNHPIEKRWIVIKGQLFLPWNHQKIPSWINIERRLGTWQNRIPEHLSGLRRLSRQEWLCPVYEQHYSNQQKIYWWTDGLYYQFDHNYFLMLKLDLNFRTIFTK